MTIIEKIRNSIQRVHGASFPVYYHDETTLNLLADTMTFPCAIVQLITDGNLEYVSGQLREVVTAAVFFVRPSQFDFDADANEGIIDDCKRKALSWLLSMQLDQYLTLVGVDRTSRAYERFDAILTGYGVLCRLTENEGVTDCPVAPYDFNNDFNEDFLIAI